MRLYLSQLSGIISGSGGSSVWITSAGCQLLPWNCSIGVEPKDFGVNESERKSEIVAEKFDRQKIVFNICPWAKKESRRSTIDKIFASPFWFSLRIKFHRCSEKQKKFIRILIFCFLFRNATSVFFCTKLFAQIEKKNNSSSSNDFDEQF